MKIRSEPIASILRPVQLIEAAARGQDPNADPRYEDTVQRFEATGSPVITDREQERYHNFWTYSVHGLSNTDPQGLKIDFKVRDRDVLEAAEYIPNTSTSRDAAFGKIRTRVAGKELAAQVLGVR
jgi:hypothetical protein